MPLCQLHVDPILVPMVWAPQPVKTWLFQITFHHDRKLGRVFNFSPLPDMQAGCLEIPNLTWNQIWKDAWVSLWSQICIKSEISYKRLTCHLPSPEGFLRCEHHVGKTNANNSMYMLFAHQSSVRNPFSIGPSAGPRCLRRLLWTPGWKWHAGWPDWEGTYKQKQEKMIK